MIDLKFTEFPKIPRLRRDVVITEKIDGTNACVLVTEDGSVIAGSRTRWITPENDNFGFARWVREHEEELRVGLGIGQHFGEWWGSGIQRAYGFKGPNQKIFSLFNVSKWGEKRPECCRVVPVLYSGPFTDEAVERALGILQTEGSRAAPGFMNPEGVVVYHTAANSLFKVTLEKDDAPKGQTR